MKLVHNHFVGIDQSNSYTGIAIAPSAWAGGLQSLGFVIMYQGDVERSYRERILPALPDQVHAIGIEKSAGVARSDTNHGKQAVIGEALGWLGGLIASPYVARGIPVLRPEPGEWRQSLRLYAAEKGELLPEVTRAQVVAQAEIANAPKPDRLGDLTRTFVTTVKGAKIVFTSKWSRCGHPWSGSLAELQDVPAACPRCAKGTRIDPAALVRDAWKKWSCDAARRLFPDSYEELVSGARARARTDKPDHQLGGVSDACDAAGVLIHTMEMQWSPTRAS